MRNQPSRRTQGLASLQLEGRHVVDATPLGSGRELVVLHGDQTGEELLHQALRLIDPVLLGTEIVVRHFDLSLANRRTTRNQVVHEAAQALNQVRFGVKAATITPEGSQDVGSPNAILRKAIDGRVIVRTGRRIPGVRSLAAVYAPSP